MSNAYATSLRGVLICIRTKKSQNRDDTAVEMYIIVGAIHGLPKLHFFFLLGMLYFPKHCCYYLSDSLKNFCNSTLPLFTKEMSTILKTRGTKKQIINQFALFMYRYIFMCKHFEGSYKIMLLGVYLHILRPNFLTKL